jgi:NADPH-ferrihemoprotein reductase
MVFVAVTSLAFWNRSFWKQSTEKGCEGGIRLGRNRKCVIQKMQADGKSCVVFFGSQTGNGQDFAERLAKEGHSRFSLKTMVADLEDYNYETLLE